MLLLGLWVQQLQLASDLRLPVGFYGASTTQKNAFAI